MSKLNHFIMEKLSFLSKLFENKNKESVYPEIENKPEPLGPLTFFGTPESKFISNKEEAQAAIREALLEMLEYNTQRGIARQDEYAMCEFDYKRKWLKPMYLYIELSDMVLMPEDYDKVFTYLGLAEILLSTTADFTQKPQANGQDVYGNLDIYLGKKITCTNRLTLSPLISAWEAHGAKYLEFKCGDFYIYGLIGSRHIVVCPKEVSFSEARYKKAVAKNEIPCPTYSCFYPAKPDFSSDTRKPDTLYCSRAPIDDELRANAFFYGYEQLLDPSISYPVDHEDSCNVMYFKGIIKNNQVSYGLYGEERGRRKYFVDSTKMPKEKFLSLVKKYRQAWKEDVIANRVWECVPRIMMMQDPIEHPWQGVSPQPHSSARVRVPDDLLSC